MLIIICLKFRYEPADEVLNFLKCDVSNELIKNNNIYVISPKVSKWKVVSGILLLLISLILIFVNYPAFAAICFIVGFTLALYDRFLNWYN